MQIWFFVLTLARPSARKRKLKDKKLSDLIRTKVGFKLNHILVLESDKLYGGMTGIPGKPLMILSEAILKELNKDELEYVILHEAAHFKYHHPIILGILQIFLVLTGLYFVQFTTTFVAIFTGILFSFIYIQISRVTERQAENFAASNMNDPKGMLTAVNKFEKSWAKSPHLKLKKFLSWNISYEEKRSIAKKYITR